MANNPFLKWQVIALDLRALLISVPLAADFPERLQALAQELIELTEAAPDATLAAILRQDASHYASVHSMHVATLLILMAKRLAWPEESRLLAVQAAFSMNVAMIALQMQLHDQHEPLSETQRREINSHPQRGYQVLFSRGITDQDWLEAVRLHHEQLHLTHEEMQSAGGRAMSQLLRILDVFCAKLSTRGYRRAMPPAQAARAMVVHERQMCPHFVDALVAEIGLYFPGSLVRLANGETAVIVRRAPIDRAPLVAALPGFDLRESARAEYAIQTILPEEAVRIPEGIARIWGQQELGCSLQ